MKIKTINEQQGAGSWVYGLNEKTDVATEEKFIVGV